MRFGHPGIGLSRILWALALLLGIGPAVGAQNWPSFRGPKASGVADGLNPPTTWDAEQGINILWKTPVPGLGHSSPIVWDDRVFVTTAVSSDPQSPFEHGEPGPRAVQHRSQHSWRVYALDLSTGGIVWQRIVGEGVPKVGRHVKASHANSTPVTDGVHLVAFFASEGLFCFDLDGNLLWKRDLGTLVGGSSELPGEQWGFGSSPIIYQGLVIVQADVQNESFIAAYNLEDGTRAWYVARDEDTSWSTPTLYEGDERAELIVSGTNYFRGYDPLTGQELWRLADGRGVKILTPVVAKDLFFLGGGPSYARPVFYALRAGANGEIPLPEEGETSETVAWKNRAHPQVITPLVYGEHLYVVRNNGILTVYDANTGERLNRWRVGGRGGAFTASPVASDGRIYLASEDGDVFVIKAGTRDELIARNPIGEVILATPAISRGMIIIRSQHHVFGIKEQ